MRLVLMGAPGAGKGTQAQILSEKLGIPHISTGDIFRNNIRHGTELGRLAKMYIEKGALVPDDITIEMIKQRLLDNDCSKGFLLDGYPRTIAQSENLDKLMIEQNIRLNAVLNIDVPDEEIVRRLSGRRICKGCGKTFHSLYSPSSKGMKCDECGNDLEQRADDNEEVILERLKNYHERTAPLCGYYEKSGRLLTIDGIGSIDDIYNRINIALGKIE